MGTLKFICRFLNTHIKQYNGFVFNYSFVFNIGNSGISIPLGIEPTYGPWKRVKNEAQGTLLHNSSSGATQQVGYTSEIYYVEVCIIYTLLEPI